MLKTKNIESYMNQNVILDDTSSPKFEDTKWHKILIRKLIYLIVVRPDITFEVNVLSHYMQDPQHGNRMHVIKC